MDRLHIGHTDDENYSFFGKLADGTPVYKHSPVKPKKDNVLKEQKQKTEKIIKNYNQSVEINQSDTYQFLEIFETEEEKLFEQAKSEKERVERNNQIDEILTKDEPKDEHKVLNYLNNPELADNNEEANLKETFEYLDLFKLEEKKIKEEEILHEKYESQKLKNIQDEESRRKKSAQKYIDFCNSLKEEELNEVKKYEQIIDEKEKELKREYDKLLIEDPIIDFYIPDSEVKIKSDQKSKTVKITNIDGVSRNFNFIGSLQKVTVSGYKLMIYSVVKDEKEYGVIKEGYRYITHRHMTYDLRDGQVIDKDTFIVSKLDPSSVTEEDNDVYADGPTSQNLTLSSTGEYFINESVVGERTLALDSLQVGINNEAVNVLPTEIVVEVFGAGGAGLSGLEGVQTGGGGGGSYAKKTYNFSAYQTYPINIRYNIGSGELADHTSNNVPVRRGSGTNFAIDWNDPHVVKEKDSYIVIDNFSNNAGTGVDTVSTVAGGGRDADWNLFYVGGGGSPIDDIAPGNGGRPFGEYDLGFIGSGFDTWSTIQYYLSGTTNESTWNTYQYGVKNFGVPGNGATDTTHGAGTNDPIGNLNTTLNVGMSSGRSGSTGNVDAVSGASPAGGGGGSGYDDEQVTEYVETPPDSGNYVETVRGYASYTQGASGGNGVVRLTVTKGIVNRALFS